MKDYINLVEAVYEKKGGIKGQRAPLKTKTGIRIRDRMVEDIAGGAILPPIVLGAILSEREFDAASRLNDDTELSKLVSNLDSEQLSIIDGMQRTTALLEAYLIKDISDNPVRVEIWFAKNINSLIYRMLILNTGQVPWDIKRQLETIYDPILARIKSEVPRIEVILIDDNERRKAAGQYQSSRLIEFFLAFSSRKTKIDLKEKVAEDFARMDAAEATASEDFVDNFVKMLGVLVDLDNAFYRARSDNSNPAIEGRFRSGKDIFTSAPAGLGFIAAASVHIYGAPGFSYDKASAKKNLCDLLENIREYIDLLNGLSDEDLYQHLELMSLNERLDRMSGKVGEFEREFFHKAFGALFTHAPNIPSMEGCWAAY